MITVVVGKHRNTTPQFSVVGEKTTRTATANCTNRDHKPHEPQPQTARTATGNRMNHDRKPYAPRPQTARTATANRTNRDRTAVLTYFQAVLYVACMYVTEMFFHITNHSKRCKFYIYSVIKGKLNKEDINIHVRMK